MHRSIVLPPRSRSGQRQVYRVAAKVAFGPAPVAVFYYQAGMLAHGVIAAARVDEMQAAFFQERGDGGHARGADLLFAPLRRAWAGVACVVCRIHVI